MISDNINTLKEKIKQICESAGRNWQDVIIVAVSKTVMPEKIKEAYDAGVRIFGENKVQEFLEKVDNLPADIKWHFVGHLQTNKVKYIIDKVELIHSVDSLKLAQEIQKQAEKKNKIMEVLVQLNTSHEDTKSGIFEDQAGQIVSGIKKLNNLKIKGLMTIGPLTFDTKRIRDSFISLRIVRDQLKAKFTDIDFKYLSMGMSEDYHIALEEGSNMIRVGTAIFGQREYD